MLILVNLANQHSKTSVMVDTQHNNAVLCQDIVAIRLHINTGTDDAFRPKVKNNTQKS